MKKILLSGSITVFIGKAISGLFQYVLIFLLGRLLGAEDTGLYFLGLAVLRVTNMFATLGLNSAVVKIIPACIAQERFRNIRFLLRFSLSATFIFSTLLGILLYWVAPYLCTNFFHDYKLIQVVRIFAFCLPIFSLFQVILGCIRSLGMMKVFVLQENVIYPIATLILSSLFLYHTKEVYLAVVATVIGLILSVNYGALMLYKKSSNFYLYGDQSQDSVTNILKLSIPLMGIGLAGMMLFWTDTIMIGALMNSKDVGVYTAAIRISLIANIILVSINTVLGPAIAQLFAQRKINELEKVYKQSTRWALHLSIPIFIVIFLFPQVVMALFGSEFSAGASAMIILSIGQLLNVSVGAAGYLLIMTGAQNIELANQSLCIILNIILNWHLIPIFGIKGAAIASATSLVASNSLRLLQNYLRLRIHPFSREMIFLSVRGK